MLGRKAKVPEKISPEVPNKAVVYPPWTFARIDDTFWLILEKTRMQFISQRAYESWGKPYVLASAESLAGYRVWKKIGFAPGTLVGNVDGQRWFITGLQPLETERRLVATPDFYNVLGYSYNNAIIVSQDELLFHREGIAISGL